MTQIQDPNHPFKQQDLDPSTDVEAFSKLMTQYSAAGDRLIDQMLHGLPESEGPVSREKIDDFSLGFNTHELKGDFEGLSKLCQRLFRQLREHFRLPMNEAFIEAFVHETAQGYGPEVPYHGLHHAADTLQFVGYLLVNCKLNQHLGPYDICALLIAALGHDLAHPGLAVGYRGSLQTLSGLEGSGPTMELAHADLLIQILRKFELPNWNLAQVQRLEELSTQSIATTNMDNHFKALAKCDELIQSGGLSRKPDPATRILLCQLALKCADISNIVRPTHITRNWAHSLMEEMSAMDAINTTHLGTYESLISLATTQLAFIDFVAKPLFAALALILPDAKECLWYLHLNKEAWQAKP